MSTATGISWTNATWNAVTGCNKVSAGCTNCYAERLAKRLQAMGNTRYKNGFRVTLHSDLVDLPRSWKKPRLVFVNSMSDVFHRDVPDAFIDLLWRVMHETHHVYQILTKRPQRMLEYVTSRLDRFPPNPRIWLGTSVEDQTAADRRIPLLAETPAVTRFLSCEPLLGHIDFDQLPGVAHGSSKDEDGVKDSWVESSPMQGINWVIIGGESGPGHRPMSLDWAREIRDACDELHIPVFYKQPGGARPGGDGLLDGRLLRAYPENTSELLRGGAINA